MSGLYKYGRIITAWQLNDKYLAMQVLKDKMGWVVSRVTVADDFISLVHARVLVGGVELLVRPPGTRQLHQEPYR